MTWQPKEEKAFKRHSTCLPSLFLQLITFIKITVLMQVRCLQYSVKNSLHIWLDNFISTTDWCYGAHKLSCSTILLVDYVTICYLL